MTETHDTTITLDGISGIVINYTYTTPRPADPYCGHDAADREAEPLDVEIESVMLENVDIFPLLAQEWVDKVEADARNAANFRTGMQRRGYGWALRA